MTFGYLVFLTINNFFYWFVAFVQKIAVKPSEDQFLKFEILFFKQILTLQLIQLKLHQALAPCASSSVPPVPLRVNHVCKTCLGKLSIFFRSTKASTSKFISFRLFFSCNYLFLHSFHLLPSSHRLRRHRRILQFFNFLISITLSQEGLKLLR